MRSRPIHYPEQAVNAVQTPASLAISVALRRARESRNVGLRAFARSLDISAQYLSALELGRRTPPIVTLAVLLTALKVDATTVDRLLQLARHSEDPDLVDSHAGHHEAIAWHFEHLSTDTITWAPALIPDLLRTPAHEIHLANHPLADPQDNGVRSFAAATRSRNFADRTRRYTFLIGDTALHACPTYIYADQLEHLRKLAVRPNVTIKIASSDACPPGLISPFTAYQQDKITLVVAVQHHHATTYLSARDTLGQYHRTVRWLRRNALDAVDALPISGFAQHDGGQGSTRGTHESQQNVGTAARDLSQASANFDKP
ncbi:Scr1 family TA system antitoxin-like transcriptional regulator [Amycolatopsis sp. NPDC051371]|uniref:Scr1 family TA system antitoxin-like transcriptional regulator n=1 Tax=Amycolatopsis sp. NPDC051371 TaxID=3155800 RepID=UPI003443C0DC